jgi:hypothetical protein
MNPSIRARIERYPAKMVKGLANTLLRRYASKCNHLLDPFCGSGEVLLAASSLGIPVTGYDINPYATLLSGVRLKGFDAQGAARLLREVLAQVQRPMDLLAIPWEQKHYWFTPRTLEKFEQMRYVASQMRLRSTPEGRSILLAMALAVRLCSRADDRSPKPFISKGAIQRKSGRHIDPIVVVDLLHSELRNVYGGRTRTQATIITRDVPIRRLEEFT